jgi:hypothetical protein
MWVTLEHYHNAKFTSDEYPLPIRSLQPYSGNALSCIIRGFVKILMALLSVVGMLTGKMIKREVLDRIKSD